MIVFFSSTAFISFFSELSSKLESFFSTDISTRLKLSASWWNYLTVGPQKCWPKNIEILKIANLTYLDLKEGWTLPIKCPQKIKTKEEWERYVKQCCSNLGDLVIAQEPRGRCDGLMVSALNSRASGLGSSPGRGHCVLFLGKTRHVPLTTQVYKWVPANLMLGITLQWTSIPSRGE